MQNQFEPSIGLGLLLGLPCPKCDSTMKRSAFNLSDSVRVRPYLMDHAFDGMSVVIERCESCRADYAVLIRWDGASLRVLGNLTRPPLRLQTS